ncbi:hypothetical protein [Mycobacterium canetti]|uniref:hypothetical protein n=1 Tax=Mycobacterium canetti TaxID=78331 RepID=UPI0005C5A427|nr:hypothetical protein [Mycobacterium canetti]
MAAGIDTSPPGVGASAALNRYWTVGPGRAKWASNPKPWTALYHLLRRHMSETKARGLATEYYVRVFGHGPSRAH